MNHWDIDCLFQFHFDFTFLLTFSGVVDGARRRYFRLLKRLNTLVIHQGKCVCLIFDENVADLADVEALWILKLDSAARLECLHLHSRIFGKQFFQRLRVADTNILPVTKAIVRVLVLHPTLYLFFIR